ncbi:MAG: o-succinylbenzoate synthase [Leptolyngbya sp. IPPAS B-1204]|nr:MAG: o-succinylbenzoate synthase [Leptolyngbya sp. IPPAS B-1204]
MFDRVRFEFRPYARRFKRPLQTHHGEWAVRQGVILRLEGADRVSWGEIVPIEWFGSESYLDALRFCQALPGEITHAQIQQIPASLPACQFGFESAWEKLVLPPPHSPHSVPQLPSSILLPTGAEALHAPQLFTASPGSTFKWKIGVAAIQDELELFEELISLLPNQAHLRLDANGGLTWQQACQWLQLCDGYGIELIEQPLPPTQLDQMLKLSQRYSTPLALDESVTTLEQLQTCYHQGWRGLFVIKAPLAGSPVQLRHFCQTHQLDIVWSSVFETAIARRYIENYLVAALPSSNRATGFGVEHWFDDGWEQRSPEQIWQRLEPSNS